MTRTDHMTTHLPFRMPHRPSLVSPCQGAPLINRFAPCRGFWQRTRFPVIYREPGAVAADVVALDRWRAASLRWKLRAATTH